MHTVGDWTTLSRCLTSMSLKVCNQKPTVSPSPLLFFSLKSLYMYYNYYYIPACNITTGPVASEFRKNGNGAS